MLILLKQKMPKAETRDIMKCQILFSELRKDGNYMRSSKYQEKKGHGCRNFLIVVIVLAIILLMIWCVIIPKAKREVASTVTKTIMEDYPDLLGTNSENLERVVNEIEEKMRDEDKAKVEKIVTNHITPSTVSEASKYVRNQDSQGLKQYVEKTLSQEEINELVQMYQKYRAQ